MTIISSDLLVLLAIPIDFSWAWLVHLTLVLNIASIALTAFYAKGLLTWLRPETVFKILLNKGGKAKSKEEAFEIVSAVRELAIGAILNHDSLSTYIALDTCESLSSAFCRRWKGEDPGFSIEHPVRQVAYYVEAICSMAYYHHDNNIHIDEWIFGSVEEIAEALMKRRRARVAFPRK